MEDTTPREIRSRGALHNFLLTFLYAARLGQKTALKIAGEDIDSKDVWPEMKWNALVAAGWLLSAFGRFRAAFSVLEEEQFRAWLAETDLSRLKRGAVRRGPAATIPEHLGDPARNVAQAFLERGVFQKLEKPGYAVRIGGPGGSYASAIFDSQAKAENYARWLAEKGEAALRKDSALKQEWAPSIREISIYEIPAGTPTISGVAGPQPEISGRLAGGGPQVAFPIGVLRPVGNPIPVKNP